MKLWHHRQFQEHPQVQWGMLGDGDKKILS